MPSFKYLSELGERVSKLNYRIQRGDSSAELELEVLKTKEPHAKMFEGVEFIGIAFYLAKYYEDTLA